MGLSSIRSDWSDCMNWDATPQLPITCTSTGCATSFSESDESVIARGAPPVRATGDAGCGRCPRCRCSAPARTGLQAHDTYAALGTADLIHTAGGGIFGHPKGRARGGVEALRAIVGMRRSKVIALTEHAKAGAGTGPSPGVSWR